jgi:outer membrane protein assembly factor BamB
MDPTPGIKLRTEGYEELSRAELLEPLEKTRGRTVTWCHPAYARMSTTGMT